MYVSPNFKSKAELKRALAEGRTVEVYAPGLGTVPSDGVTYLEGPHFPEAHRWYAQGVMQGGKLVKVK